MPLLHHRPRPRTDRRALGAAVAVVGLAVAGCGRSAPTEGLPDISDDPDIAGVSVTSPDAVITTVSAAEGEPVTSTTVLQQQEIRYTVSPGDTLSAIATRYNVSVDALAQYNGITDVNSISPGQELAIPPQTAGPTPAPEPTTTTVP